MNNDFEQPSQYSQGQPQWDQPSQYGQPQFPQSQQQWGQQYEQPQQFPQGQPQWGQQQQYPPVPEYARAQPNDNNTTANWLMGWLAYRAIVRIVVPIVIILLVLGACVFFGLLSAVFH
jgi:hypothetical protein